jgi:hypothetical protein
MLKTPSVATTTALSVFAASAAAAASASACANQPVQQHSFAATSERRHHRKVSHVTRGEQQRPFAPGEGSEFFFEASVFGTVARHQM